MLTIAGNQQKAVFLNSLFLCLELFRGGKILTANSVAIAVQIIFFLLYIFHRTQADKIKRKCFAIHTAYSRVHTIDTTKIVVICHF